MEFLKYMSFSINVLFMVATGVIAAVMGYFFIISVFGWRRRKEKQGAMSPAKNYAVIIAAHNEQTVIRSTINSVKAMDYPKDKFEVFVIADNCSDDTAAIARECGAVVFERRDNINKGKGKALSWIFDVILKAETEYDAVCILDADNLVSKDFLSKIDKKMREGYQVVQGYRDMKNPWESWITSSYSITYWLANRLCQLPRQYLNINCTLTGSGYAINLETIRCLGWKVETLTEDVEFYFQLCLSDVKIGWAHDAVIYDEQPITLSQSWKQRTRWMQGHFSCVFLYGRRAVSKLFRERSLQAFDAVVMMFYPFFYVIGSLLMLLQLTKSFLVQIDDPNIRSMVLFLSISVTTFIMQNLYSVWVLLNEKKADKNLFMGLALLPFFNFTWVPIMIQGYFSRKNKEWAHIAHNSSALKSA
ncbi:beta-monoglucosyldiacylglycerol synthase [Ruminiclostridium hungatei]|uniref:Beta-monoglucosyldiacylglycerol synthase n=1 Tax=Ruminiclostridium hungatei TaxID=48256 RepID=A0A1V4SF57_RUMHU|nr:glycosyltransferase family 2 protein [Ruminiclostridium hungatei]OPX42373.1 beta-monoglucosyldiacylglycerol synthase [Ruminiclostridium hungatei]